RCIFTRVFSKNRPIEIIHSDLSADQRLADLRIQPLVVRDGWVGLSVLEEPRVERTARSTSHARGPRGLR
ncbi:MAG TPA: hypothetical protein VIY86_12265, partial [Pirellulaceae bacterium]